MLKNEKEILGSTKGLRRKVKLGVVANEFFDLSIGRMGGFGWATQQLAKYFNSHPELGVELVFLSREHCPDQGISELFIHGTRLISLSQNKLHYIHSLWKEKFDLLLSIDYRPSYRSLFWILPRTPIIIWVRDPRPPADVARVKAIRIPEVPDTQPAGLNTPQCTSLSQVVKVSQWLHALFDLQRQPLSYETKFQVLMEPNLWKLTFSLISLT